MSTIMMIAGGTGGHIFPALAVAHELQSRGHRIHWLGSAVGLEKKLVPPHFPLTCLSISRLRGKGLWTKCLMPLRLMHATGQALRAIKKIKPDLVVGMGGFASAPGGLAAKLAGIPLIIQEQNAVAGMANRMLAKFAKQVICGFPNAFASRVPTQVVGNPVRKMIAQLDPPSQRKLGDPSRPLHVFVLGGSQGAHALNRLIPEALAACPEQQQIKIWHQTGPNDYDAVCEQYAAMDADATVDAFIDDMSKPYAWADFMICRAGALTVAEVAAAGVGSLMVPFPYAVDDHQWHNAKYLVDQQAALVVRQAVLSAKTLAAVLSRYCHDRQALRDLAERARALAKPDATAAIATICINLIEQKEIPCDTP